jgi:hypothetical protein
MDEGLSRLAVSAATRVGEVVVVMAHRNAAFLDRLTDS